MSYLDEVVLFKQLKEWYGKSNGCPYKNQDWLKAGRDEIHSVFVGNELQVFERLDCARAVAYGLVAVINDGESMEGLLRVINEYPIIDYYRDFIEVMEILIKSGIVNEDKVWDFGKRLTFESSSKEEIKLGLTLLNFGNIDKIIEELKIMATHNEFSFYVCQLLKQVEECNDILFDLAKKSKAAGRLNYTNSIEILENDIIEWLLSDGWKDDNYQNLIWETTVMRVGLDYFLQDENMNQSMFMALGEIINHIFIHYDYSRIPYFNESVEAYLNEFEIYSKDVNSYIALKNIFKYLMDEVGPDSLFYKKAQKYYLKVNWMEILRQALEDAEIDSALIFQLAIEMEEDPTIDEIEKLLKRNPKDILWYKYIEMLGETEYSNRLIDFVKENLKLDLILSGPEPLMEDQISDSSTDDICLLMAVEGMTVDSSIKNQEFLVQCLNAKLVETRLAVIERLAEIKDYWEDNIKEKIEYLIDREVVNSIRNKMRFLLYEKRNNDLIYTDIDYPEELIDEDDVYLFKTRISSKIANRLESRKVLLKDGDILTVLNGLDGYHDDKVFVVTNFGILLGELSAREGHIIRNLIKGGERIAAKIERYDDSLDFIYLNLYKKSDSLIKELSTIISKKVEKLNE